MAGRHRGQCGKHLSAPNFPDDYPVGSHTQGRPDEVEERYLALTFDVRTTSNQRHCMGTGRPQFGRLLDGNDALVGGNTTEESIENSRLPASRGSADRDACAIGHRGP